MTPHSTIKKTKDGSTTLYSSRFGQHYHNPNGAVAESRLVFFERPGLPEALRQKSELHIFEMGFGTGLNLIILLDYLHKTGSKATVTFHSVEAFPVEAETALQLDFGEELKPLQPVEILSDIFGSLKQGINTFSITDQLRLELFVGYFADSPAAQESVEDNTGTHRFDFIFHDPFSPEVNAGLWTPEVFKSLAVASQPGAILTTYCAATSARAAMAVAGWHIARARGALGKREMTIASLDPQKLASFKQVNEKRLIDRFEAGDFDNPSKTL